MNTEKLSTVDGRQGDEGSPWGRYSLLVKLNLTIGISFLLTMALFLLFSYHAEKAFELDHSTRLMRSTLELLAERLDESGPLTPAWIQALQSRLDAAGIHHHMVLLADASERITLSANPGQAGKSLSQLFPRRAGDRMPPGAALVSDGSAWWLRVGKPLPNGETLYLLLHWGHVASNLRTFWTIHGLHVVVTLAVFFVLLWLSMEWFVRRRLVVLLKAIQRMEMGRWDSDSEVSSRDEFGWLHARFREMGQKLKENVDRLVRAEKYASAAIVVLRVAREMNGPLASIRSDIQRLSRDLDLNDGAAIVVADLDLSIHEIERCIRKLTDIKHPSEWEL